MKGEIVRVKCIRHKYADKTEVEICGLSFVVYKGEKVALIGPNGSGKTTLLNHIIGFLKTEEGEIKVFDVDPYKNVNKIVRKLGVVFQNVDYQLIGPTVYDDIAFTALNFGMEKSEVIKRVDKIMKELGIEHLKNKVPHYLSGGEKKKVAIAGAIIHGPELLVLDEPFAEVDEISRKRIMKLLDRMNRDKNTTIIIATNQLDIVRNFADTVYVMEKGRIKFRGKPKDLLKKKLKVEVCRH